MGSDVGLACMPAGNNYGLLHTWNFFHYIRHVNSKVRIFQAVLRITVFKVQTRYR